MQDNPKVGAKRSHPGGSAQKYVLDEYNRQLIIEMYSKQHNSLEAVSARIGVPRRIASKWVAELGLGRRSWKRWTAQEMTYLKRNWRSKSLEDIAFQLKKSPDTVYSKAKNLGLTGCPSGYTKHDIMLGFGVKAHDTIDKWIAKGWLKGRKSSPSSCSYWEFTDRQVRSFIIEHPDQVNPHKMDWLWVVDILAGENGIGRLDESYERSEE